MWLHICVTFVYSHISSVHIVHWQSWVMVESGHYLLVYYWLYSPFRCQVPVHQDERCSRLKYFLFTIRHYVKPHVICCWARWIGSLITIIPDHDSIEFLIKYFAVFFLFIVKISDICIGGLWIQSGNTIFLLLHLLHYDDLKYGNYILSSPQHLVCF